MFVFFMLFRYVICRKSRSIFVEKLEKLNKFYEKLRKSSFGRFLSVVNKKKIMPVGIAQEIVLLRLWAEKF